LIIAHGSLRAPRFDWWNRPAVGPSVTAHRHGRINAARRPVFRPHLLNIGRSLAKIVKLLVEFKFDPTAKYR
jgi:hypothetical protein